MAKYPQSSSNNNIQILVTKFENLKHGRPNAYLDEVDFETLTDYFEDSEQYSKALEVAQLGVEQYPFSASLLIRKADFLIVNKRYNQALQTLQKAEMYDATDINIYILKTDAYLALDMQAEAAEILEAALQNFEGEEKIELLFQLADVYDDYEDFNKIYDCLQLILQLDANNEEALYKICFWADYTNRNDESIIFHQKLLDEHPFSTLAWFNLASAYQSLKLYEKAIDAYEYCVALDEKFDIAYRNLADAQIRTKDYKNAIENLKRALTLAKPEDVLYEAIGHCYDKQADYANARFYYKKASHLTPDDATIYYKVATTYLNQNNFASALKFLETAIKYHPNSIPFNYAFAQCYAGLQQFDKALNHVALIINLKPKHKKAWELIVQCLIYNNQLKDALLFCDEAFDACSNNIKYVYYQSYILLLMGKSKEALVLLNRALQQSPKQLKGLIEFAPALMQNQKVVAVIAKYKTKKGL
jgi:tetratricopeptide (TPR) repeat protein